MAHRSLELELELLDGACTMARSWWHTATATKTFAAFVSSKCGRSAMHASSFQSLPVWVSSQGERLDVEGEGQS